MATTPISGLTPSSAAVGTTSIRSLARVMSAPAEAEDANSTGDAVSLDLFPSSPPPEVLAAISAASDAYDSLSEAGLHVSVGDGAGGHGLDLELHDQDGNVLSTLTPSEVLALAEGKNHDPARKPNVDDQYDELDD